MRQCVQGPEDLSLASTVLGPNRSRDAPPTSLQPPSKLFSNFSFQLQHSEPCSQSLCLWDQPTPYFEGSSLLLISPEFPYLLELFHPSGGHHQPPGWQMHADFLWAYLSLGFYFLWTMWLWREGAAYSRSWLRRSARELNVPSRHKTSAAAVPCSRMYRSFPRLVG